MAQEQVPQLLVSSNPVYTVDATRPVGHVTVPLSTEQSWNGAGATGTHAVSGGQPPPAWGSAHVSPWSSVTAGLVSTLPVPVHAPATVTTLEGAPIHQAA